MLNVPQEKIDEIDEDVYKEIKNASYSGHLNMIDGLVKRIQQDYPDFSPGELVTKLSDIAEKASEQEATMMLKYKKEVSDAIKQEFESYKQVKVAA